MKKLLAGILTMVMVLTLCACGGGGGAASTTQDSKEPEAEVEAEAEGEAEASAESALVGVAMPTKDLQRWNQDGENMKSMLEAAGYEVDLQYGANDIQTQVSQIENMISNGCKVLVIASIDGDSLGTVLAQAKEKAIPVIAYDRLIMNSDAVTYYATFDNWLVGTKQGEFIRDALDLDNAEGPFNIEFITGDPGDNNINFFFDGAMSILQPYLDSGKLVCPSGQTEKAVVATANWATDAAQSRFENILSSNYADGTPLHAVLASNDSTALGVENALASSYSNDVYPVITGQDCDVAIMKNLIEGKQAMSIFKDTRTLASKVVEMVDALMKGEEPPINDTETYDNGTGIIPSFLCEPVSCTVDNYKELLIDSGYYTEDELK
ncbi:MAG: sugar ABC transporter substrate-binding protein [Eubacteriales bacterium]|nr:sugar ABC transporter substrate-binding protein [Eubacteriales bacterium]